MKVFDRDCKWNFVDDNNVFVGYYNQQECCENADYLLTKTIPKSHDEPSIDPDELDGYNFDTKFFQKVVMDLDAGEAVAFRLVKDASEDVFLTLYNYHNGYYGHGFEATIGGIDWQNGNL